MNQLITLYLCYLLSRVSSLLAAKEIKSFFHCFLFYFILKLSAEKVKASNVYLVVTLIKHIVTLFMKVV